LLARRSLILAGAGAGTTLACVVTLTLGVPGAALGTLDGLQAKLIAIRISATGSTAGHGATANPSPPLFSQQPPVLVRLEGVSISHSRKAALISVNGAATDWLELGESRAGVTLTEVRSDAVTIDTDSGERRIRFGDGPAAAPVAAGPTASPLQRGPQAGTIPPAAPYQPPSAVNPYPLPSSAQTAPPSSFGVRR
jgi:hypothetical protein